MKFGTLRIRFLDGTDRDYPLDLPAAVVGRGEGVSLVVDDFSISRRHASIAIDTGNLLIEDLGSATGTFLNGERLTPHVRYVVDPGDDLRIGDLEAVYYPPPPAEAATTAGNAEGLPGGLHVALVSPAVPIDPGKNVTATLAVTNRARIVDEIELTIPALPASWYTIVTPRFSLVPNAREEVQIVLHPPREHASLAGEYDFAVHVRSHEQGQEFIASGSFTLLPFESASVSLATIRTKRDFKVIAENSSNQPITLDLTGRDDDQAFQYQFAQPAVSLQPGEKTVVPLRVKRRRQLFGQPSQPFFEVIGKSRGTGSEVSARGQLAIHPPLEKFKMPVLFMLGAIILAFTAIAVLVITDNDGVQRAGAESEYAGVHLCDDPGSEPRTSSGGGTASDGPVRPDATIAGAGNNSGGTPIFGNADSQGGPFFAQNDPRWADVEYARSTELPGGKDWCGTTIAQCGCAMTSVGVMLALYQITELPDGSQLNPEALNAWFNGEARRTERGWVSRGYIYGDVIWAAANAISGEMAKRNPGTTTIRFVRKGTGTEDEIRGELNRGRPVILEVPGHWIAAVGIDAATGDILINDPFYRDRTTLNVYAGKVRSSVIFEPSNDLSAVVLTAPADVKFRVIDKQGRVVGAGDVPDADAVVQIPGASFDSRRAWRDPTCIEQAPPPGAGTNQIMLPGNADDYTIEILDTGGQPGSVAVHTYGRDGTASISTIDTAGAAVAELSVDPETGTTNVQVTTGGTPAPATTPTPGGGAGGVEETPTPTTEPTVGPPPTPTPTPFEAATTNITIGAEPGQTRVETASNAGFELGDPIRFAPGQPNEEDNIIVGFGSMLLATPLRFAHGPGEVIERLPRPPGQGPGLPPGITPPPSTGPLEPPSTVGLACSTIYQPSPKLATFICDLQVTGEYTITRWTLNGQIVPEFTGSNSFVMAFPEDTPASIAASVCNVTICRSVSRQETIDFGTGLGNQGNGNGGQTGPGGPSGPTVQPTPVPQGQVVVVCTAQFPTTEDGQVAVFNCKANFSGSYTSIAWSAPGGTPPSASGQSDTFQTTIADVAGAPTFLNVTATICNFGNCFTSTPTRVGVTRTLTILDSQPQTQVNSGHSITLMAQVRQLDGDVVPQGGVVVFRRNGEQFGNQAPVFTVGSIAVAQVTAPAGHLPSDQQEQEMIFDAIYMGSINAFGSTSQPRTITLLPRIADGCDSLDEDPGDGPLVDASCQNTATAGGYGGPKDLGGGTIVDNISITGGTADLAPNSRVVGPGAVVTVSGTMIGGEYCPGCIRQLYIGIAGYDSPVRPDDISRPAEPGDPTAIDHPNKTLIGPNCPVPGVVLPTGSTRQFSTELTAPTKPGVYYIRAATTLNYFCVGGVSIGSPAQTVGRIIVQGPADLTLEIWSIPEAGVWGALPGDGANAPQQLNEMPPNGEVLLRVITNPPLPAGTVTFSHGGNFERRINQTTWSTNVVANLCNPTTTPGCTPGEARVIVRPSAASPGRAFNVTATLEDQILLLPHPSIPGQVQAYEPFLTDVSNAVGFTVLAPSRTTIGVSPAGNVEICTGDGCPVITLTATVVPAEGTQAPTGGLVTFERRPSPGTDNDWVPMTCNGPFTGIVPANGVVVCDLPVGSSEADLGAYRYRARFARGQSTFLASDSPASEVVTFVRAQIDSIEVSVTTPSVVLGAPATFEVEVKGKNGFAPTGTVTFTANGTPLPGAESTLSCTGDICTATRSFTTGNAPIGSAVTYQIRAVYNGSLTMAPSSPSAPKELDVQRASPQVVASAATAVVGAQLTLSATVSGTGQSSPAGGSVSFYLGSVADENLLGTDTSLSSGNPHSASISVPTGIGTRFPNTGPYSVIARFNGNASNGNVAAENSDPAAVTISVRGSTTTVVSGLSGALQTQIELRANVVPVGVATTVVSPECTNCLQFQVDVSGTWTNISGALVSVSSTGAAQATFAIPTPGGLFNNAGSYSIRAVYNDAQTANTNLARSESTAGTFTVNPVTPTVSINTISPVVIGNPLSMTATVSTGTDGPSPDGGSVTFRLGSTILGTATVSGGSATLSNIQTGPGTSFPTAQTYTNVNAQYNGQVGGNVGNATSAPTSVTVNHASLTITFLPVGSVDMSQGGSVVLRVELTGFHMASITANPPSAAEPPQLVFERFNGTSWDTLASQAIVPLNGAVGAEYHLSGLYAGNWTIRARYTGNGVYAEQSSASKSVTIRPVVTISPIANVTLGNSFSITANVDTGPGGFSPNGATVTFLLGTTVLGTATANASGVATLSGIATGASTNFPTATTYNNITARFESTTTIPQGTSPAVSVTVTAP